MRLSPERDERYDLEPQDRHNDRPEVVLDLDDEDMFELAALSPEILPNLSSAEDDYTDDEDEDSVTVPAIGGGTTRVKKANLLNKKFRNPREKETYIRDTLHSLKTGIWRHMDARAMIERDWGNTRDQLGISRDLFRKFRDL